MTSPSPEALSAFKSALGPGGWTDDSADIAPWLTEWRNRWQGHTPLMLTPRSTEEVARAVRVCAEHRVAIVPQGGDTGLVGGQIPYGEVLLSTRKLRAVRDVTPLDDAMTVEAGVTLLEAQQAATAADRMFPLSLAAEGTATIGGVISTNAGGTAVIRYGVMRDLVLGIEAVMPDGEIFHGLKRLRKDNTGYDLKQLLIGAEGTLGVVTAATLKLFPIMRSRATAVVGLDSPHAAIDLLARAKSETGGGVEAFELMKRLGVQFALTHIPDTREPLDTTAPWYVLIELVSGEPGGAEAGMERLLSTAFETGLITDAAIAQNDGQRAAFWKMREEQSAAQKPEGGGWKHDVSVPVSRIANFLDEPRRRSNASTPERVSAPSVMSATAICTMTCCARRGLTCPPSWRGGRRLAHRPRHRRPLRWLHLAEHGLGRLKTDEARRYKSPLDIRTMQAIRAAIDPHRIMNPAVLF